jgi:transcriptional regulator with XRE-family HTH domain
MNNNKLKELREARGLSKTALSKLSGVSRPTINKLENQSEIVTNTQTLTKLSEALGVSIRTLFLPPKFNEEDN